MKKKNEKCQIWGGRGYICNYFFNKKLVTKIYQEPYMNNQIKWGLLCAMFWGVIKEHPF